MEQDENARLQLDAQPSRDHTLQAALDLVTHLSCYWLIEVSYLPYFGHGFDAFVNCHQWCRFGGTKHTSRCESDGSSGHGHVVREFKNGVDVVLPEQYFHTVGLNQEVAVTISALNNTSFIGSIREIFPAADAKSRSFLIKVTLPVDPRLRYGMFARVSIPVGESSVLTIPSTAVIHSGQLTGVYIVDDTQTAKFRLIRTGRLFGDAVEVLSGLKQGDRYVAAPPPNLINGMKVEMDS